MNPRLKKRKKSRKQNENSTMTDIAIETGLSKMTISRVFTGSANVRSSTKERVMAAATKLGYEYNSLAGNFASGRSRLIGIAIDVASQIDSHYFSCLFKGIHRYLGKADYHTVILDTGSKEFANGERLSKIINQRRVEGVLTFVPTHNRADFVASFRQDHTSIVVIGGRTTTAQVPWVDLDNHHAVDLLVNHLCKLGHKRIGFISDSEQIIDALDPSDAFASIQAALHLQQQKDRARTGKSNYGAGREAAHRILSLPEPPTAIIAPNDYSALGACEAIRAYGMTPGKEISVVGIDGHDIAAKAEPAITTISQPLEAMGERAAMILLKKIEGYSITEQETYNTFQGTLLARPSTGPAPQ